MKERNRDVVREEDTKGMPRKEQEAISRLRTCNTHLPVDHILWEWKETEGQRTNMMDIKKNNGSTGKKVWKR
jgi:hypothetical protein